MVNFEGNEEWIGQIVPVQITGSGTNTLRGIRK